MNSPITADENRAIVQGLNLALQKFLSEMRQIEEEEKELVGQLDQVATRIKQRKLKKVINKL